MNSIQGKPLTLEVKRVVVSVKLYFDSIKISPKESNTKRTADAVGIGEATALSVTKVLRAISESAGIPIQILSDNGSNLKRGIKDFIEEVQNKYVIRQTYDVTHKAAIILKHHLKDDENWKLFVNFSCMTKRSLIHTVIGFVSPPKPRDKARWLNLDIYICRAENILYWSGKRMKKAEREKFNDKLLWVRMFKPHISEWRTMLDLLQALKSEIKINGLSVDTKSNFEKLVRLY